MFRLTTGAPLGTFRVSIGNESIAIQACLLQLVPHSAEQRRRRKSNGMTLFRTPLQTTGAFESNPHFGNRYRISDPTVLFIDSRGTCKRAAPFASQSHIAGARDGDLVPDIHHPSGARTVDDARWRSWISAIIRGADTGYFHRPLDSGVSRVLTVGIGTRRYRF